MSYTMRRGAPRLRTTEDGPEKYCAYCCDWWPLECFRPHPAGVGGLDNRCKACQQEYLQRWYLQRRAREATVAP